MYKQLITRITTLFAGLVFSINLWAAAININTADAETLADGLVGIGPVVAAKIIADREQNGPYETVDDLQRVKGIGSKTIEKNRDSMTVEASSAND